MPAPEFARNWPINSPEDLRNVPLLGALEADLMVATQAVQLQTLRPERLEAQAAFQQVHLRGQRLCFSRVIKHFELMAVFRHNPRLQFSRQCCLGRILRAVGRLNHVFSFQRMNRRFCGAPPGFAHFFAHGVVRALGDAA